MIKAPVAFSASRLILMDISRPFTGIVSYVRPVLRLVATINAFIFFSCSSCSLYSVVSAAIADIIARPLRYGQRRELWSFDDIRISVFSPSLVMLFTETASPMLTLAVVN